MAWKCVVMALSVFTALVANGDLSVEDDVQAFVDAINSKQSMWTAAKRDITDMRNMLLQNQLEADIYERSLQDPTIPVHEIREINSYIPPSYDPGKDYPECNIRRIKHQYKCGCCWATASAGVMQDRLCIHSHGQIKVNISAAYLVGCCKTCTVGCKFGSATHAFKFMMRNGVVTGGEYDSDDGCYPYPLCPTCDTPEGFSCPNSCPNIYYNKDMENDKYYVSQVRIVKKNAPIRAIQHELFKNGPVVIQMNIYEDFMYYTGGIYQHTQGKLLGAHYMRLIGYGNENGVDYWIVVNSWRPTWGEDGTFRIRRGVNESGIEACAITALPDLSMYN